MTQNSTHVQPWPDVLTLMGAVVMSDGVILREEIDAFTHGVHQLSLRSDIRLFEDDPSIERWFADRYGALKSMRESKSYESEIVKLIIRLKRFAHRQALHNILGQIANSDHDVHPNELDIIVLAQAYWDLE